MTGPIRRWEFAPLILRVRDREALLAIHRDAPGCAAVPKGPPALA